MSKNSKTVFTDDGGDALEIASGWGGAYVFLTTFAEGDGESPDDGTPVMLDAAQAVTLRKELKKWLLKHGHIEPKARKPEQGDGLVLTFDDEDEHTILAVTLQDEEGRIKEVLWER